MHNIIELNPKEVAAVAGANWSWQLGGAVAGATGGMYFSTVLIIYLVAIRGVNVVDNIVINNRSIAQVASQVRNAMDPKSVGGSLLLSAGVALCTLFCGACGALLGKGLDMFFDSD